jgi:hypothetical protein
MGTMKKRKTTTRRNGNARLPIAVALTAVWFAPACAAPLAVVSGTVFREPGFALRGALIVATPLPAGAKKQEWKTASDARGEFILRVPPGPASYNVSVTASGFETQKKTVTLAGDERIELSFVLAPATEKGEQQ